MDPSTFSLSHYQVARIGKTSMDLRILIIKNQGCCETNKYLIIIRHHIKPKCTLNIQILDCFSAGIKQVDCIEIVRSTKKLNLVQNMSAPAVKCNAVQAKIYAPFVSQLLPIKYCQRSLNISQKSNIKRVQWRMMGMNFPIDLHYYVK